MTVLPLNLRGPVKPLFLRGLAEERADLVPRYRRLYGRQAHVSQRYQDWLHGRVGPLLERHGFGQGTVTDGAGRPEEGAYPQGSSADWEPPGTATGRPHGLPDEPVTGAILDLVPGEVALF